MVPPRKRVSEASSEEPLKKKTTRDTSLGTISPPHPPPEDPFKSLPTKPKVPTPPPHTSVEKDTGVAKKAKKDNPETPTRPTKTSQPSSHSKYGSRPPVGKTWATFGSKHAGEYLQSVETFDAYCIACRYFHGWLAFVARGFSIDELKQIFSACLPAFLRDGEDYEKKMALKEFKNAFVWVEDQLLSRLRGYATTWLESPGGLLYQERYKHHRIKRKATVPTPPTPDHCSIKNYEGTPCIQWGTAQLIDIWMPCLAAVTTEDTGQEYRLGWIDDPTDIWMRCLDVTTPHLVVEMAKIKLHNKEDGFARDPVRALIRRTMTFALDSSDVAPAKAHLTIRKNETRIPLDISRYEVALSSTQTAKLLSDLDPSLFESDPLHTTPTQVKEKEDEFAIKNAGVVQKEQTIEGALMCEHAGQVAEINQDNEFRTVKHSFLTIRAPVIASEDALPMARAYVSKGLFGQIGQVRLEVELERKRLMAISMHALKRAKELNKELRLLDAEEKLRATTQTVIRAELLKVRAKEKLVADKKKSAQGSGMDIDSPMRLSPSTTNRTDDFQDISNDNSYGSKDVDSLLDTEKGF